MENIPKISVIVPIYNSEKYLRRCIDSIICQTLKDIEIILCNDGSTDGSRAICQEYLSDPRVKYLEHSNHGCGRDVHLRELYSTLNWNFLNNLLA